MPGHCRHAASQRRFPRPCTFRCLCAGGRTDPTSFLSTHVLARATPSAETTDAGMVALSAQTWQDEPGNLRPIALQNIACKAIFKLFRYHLQPFVDRLMRQAPQYAYTQNRGTAEANASIVQHCDWVRSAVWQQKLDLHAKYAGAVKCECVGGAMLSVDFSRVFDSMPRNLMRDVLCWADVPSDLTTAILVWHAQGSYKLGQRADASLQMEIDATQGVRQGCMLAPSIWVFYTCGTLSRFSGSLSPCNHKHIGGSSLVHFRRMRSSIAASIVACSSTTCIN